MTDYFEGAPLGALIYDRTYSRNGETWPETVQRVVRGNLSLVPAVFQLADEEALLVDLMTKRAILPAGRHLWMSGVSDRQYLANCFVAPWETAERHFGFMFGELMKGGGVGANYSSHHVALLPWVKRNPQVVFVCDKAHPDFQDIKDKLTYGGLWGLEDFWHVVDDSREGWVEALTSVLELATRSDDKNPIVVLDVSKIRAKGEPISTFGGIAAGPGPLIDLIYAVCRELGRLVRQPWTAEACMSIDHAIAEAVISGNVRRSARMSILHWNDPEIEWFLNCKKNPEQHWSTNISVEVDWAFFLDLKNPNGKAHWVMSRIVEGMMANGEPGIFNSQLANVGERNHIDCTNPCGEIALEPGEPCVLGHVNLAYAWRSEHELRRAFILMARFLVRATNMDSTDALTKDVLQRNRRIGVGFFGLQEMMAREGYKLSNISASTIPNRMASWKSAVVAAADAYARSMGMEAPIKHTTVAPTGTIAKLAGTSEGIHPIFAKYYIRRVRYADNDPQLESLIAQGIEIEKDVHSANTVVASFPTQDAVCARVGDEYIQQANEIHPALAMEIQACIQGWYADNAISHTISVSPNLKPSVLKSALLKWLPVLKGVTIFPELSRPQSPLERLTKDEYDMLTYHSVGQTDEECTNGCPIR